MSRLQSSPGQLRAAIDAAEEENRYVGPRAHEALREIDAVATTLAMRTRDRHMERVVSVGGEATEEFGDLVALGQSLGDRVVHGEVSIDEARRELDRLMARFELVDRRVLVFETAAKAAEEIEADPLAFAERLYEAHPSIRPEVEI